MSFIAFMISTAALRDAVKPAMAEISSMRVPLRSRSKEPQVGDSVRVVPVPMRRMSPEPSSSPMRRQHNSPHDHVRRFSICVAVYVARDDGQATDLVVEHVHAAAPGERR
jgi:hypothetical protein